MRRRRTVATAALAAVPALFAVTTDAAAASEEPQLAERFAATLGGHDVAGFAALFADDYTQRQASAAAPKPPIPRTSCKSRAKNSSRTGGSGYFRIDGAVARDVMTGLDGRAPFVTGGAAGIRTACAHDGGRRPMSVAAGAGAA